MRSHWMSHVLLAGLAIALLRAAATDLSRRRIGNALNAAIALTAPLFWWASGLGWPGIAVQLALAAASFAVLCGLFALRALGGGDVKLLSALALWIAPVRFVHLVAMMALLGGLLAVAMAAWQVRPRGRRPAGAVARPGPGHIAIPYGVAIAGAGLWVLACDYIVPR